MKNNFLLIAIIALIFSCRPKPKNENIEYNNLVIVTDLSSRISNYPNKDFKEINSLIDYFRNDCVKPGLKSNDKSSIYFSALTEQEFIGIDIDSIKDLAPKQMFVNSTGEFKNKGLDFKISILKNRIKNTYENVRNPGLDLISILNEKIHKNSIIKQDITSVTNGKIDSIKYNNHFYVFTDGYLEYLNPAQNDQFYYSLPQIENVRKFCISNKVSVETALKNNSKLGLPPLMGEKNRLINLHIVETHERDKDFVLNKYLNKDGLRDNQILEAVWRKWALESGFKSFDWKKY